MTKRPLLVFLLALVVYLAYRALVLATNFDAVAIPVYELLFGNIGEVTRAGWVGPPLAQYYDNCGGHLVVGLLSAPVFAAVGPSYLALKLIPLTLGAAALALLWRIARREFGTLAACLAVLCFAIGPPTLAKYSLLAKGNHFENLAFQLLALLAFYRVFDAAPGSAARRRALWLFGGAAGFAVFFYFGSLILLALLGVTYLLVRGPRGLAADLVHLVPAFLIGLSPLLWIQLSGGARPEVFLESHFVGEGGTQAAEIDRVARLKELLFDFLPRGTCFEDLGPVPGRVADGAYLALFLVAWLVLLAPLLAGVRRALASLAAPAEPDGERRRFEALRLLPLVGYLPAFVVLYVVSRFEFDVYLPPVEIGQFRYLVPHYMLACLVVAIASARLVGAGGARRALGWALVGGVLLLDAFSLPVIDLGGGHGDLAARYPGFDFHYERAVLLRDGAVDPVSGETRWDLARLEAQLGELPRRWRQDAAFGVGHWRAWAQTMPPAKRASAPRAPHLSLAELCATPDTAQHVELARGMGSFLGDTGGAARWLPRLQAEGHALLPCVVEGLCLRAEFPLSRNVPRWLERAAAEGAAVPQDLRWAWWRGQGLLQGRLLARGVAADVEAVRKARAQTPPEGARELWFGTGQGFGEELGDLAAPPRVLAALPEGARLDFVRGLGAGLRHRLGLQDAAPVFQAWSKQLGEAERGALEQGLRWPSYPVPARLP
ncbi:MAG: hypothetical protein H6828_03810 [Planctomycetes bacterium]|nr:hypothetical protein [Planctomycetota bacterium]